MNAPPEETAHSVPVFRISLTSATMLSIVYLVIAVLVEAIRRVANPRWAETLALTFEAFPARMLTVVGLHEPLRQAAASGALSITSVRLVYGVTTVALFFALSFIVGAAMWVVARLAGAKLEE